MRETMVNSEPTQILFDKAQAGDRDAFQELVGQFSQRLQNQIRVRMGPRVRGRLEVDDLHQETLLRAFESIGKVKWDGEERFYRWMSSIAEHLILNATQKRSFAELKLDDREVASDSSPSKPPRRFERFERLEQAFQHLSPDQRKALALSRLEGLKLKEVAKAMGRSPEAVRKLIARALLQLKANFGDTESLHLPDMRLDRDGRESHD